MTETNGKMSMTRRTMTGKADLIMAPLINGARTIIAALLNNAKGETGTRAPARSCMRRGIAKTLHIVETRVSKTERATSARAIRQTRLLATPPGQTPTRMRPTVKGGGREKRRDRNKERKGMIVYWERAPRRIWWGVRRMDRKEEGEIVRPMPSMMRESVGKMRGGVNQRKVGGRR